MPHFTFKIFLAWVELGLLIWERYSEVNLLIEYHRDGHMWWFGLTAAFLSAPGALYLYYYIVTAIKERRWMKNIAKGIIIGVFFPIGQLLW